MPSAESAAPPTSLTSSELSRSSREKRWMVRSAVETAAVEEGPGAGVEQVALDRRQTAVVVGFDGHPHGALGETVEVDDDGLGASSSSSFVVLAVLLAFVFLVVVVVVVGRRPRRS